MHELKNDELDKIMEKEEPEGMEFYLMAGMKPGASVCCQMLVKVMHS